MKKLSPITKLVIKAQEKKLAEYRRKLLNSKTETEAAASIQQISRIYCYLINLRKNGFYSEVR